MGWLSDRFRSKRRARRNPISSDEFTEGGGAHTVQIPRLDAPRPSTPEPGGWGEAPADDPFARSVASSDAPTQLAPRPPPPPPRFPAPPPPASEGNETVLGTLGGAAKGKVVAVLLGVEGPLEGHVIRVFDGDNLLGREGQPDPLPNTPEAKTISRKHAMLCADGGYFAVEPVDTKNATFVNEKLIDARELIQHGDRVRLGSVKPSDFVLLVVP